MKKMFGNPILVALVALSMLLAACGQPGGTTPQPTGYVTMSVGVGQLGQQALAPQGVPYDNTGIAAVGLVDVQVLDKGGQLVQFEFDGTGYRAATAGSIGSIALSPSNESAQLTLLEAGNPYTFVANGYKGATTGSVIAYDSQQKFVGNATTVRLGLESVLGGAVLVPRYPSSFVYPSAAPFDLLLVVMANGHSTFPGSDYLQVPLTDFSVDYGAVTGAAAIDSTNRGMRLQVSSCELAVAAGSVSGLVWDAALSRVVPGTVGVPAFAMGCPTTGTTVEADLEAPTVTLEYDAATHRVTGSAVDANDRIAKVQVWDGAMLVASTDEAETGSAVALIVFDLGLNTFRATLTQAPSGGLVALAFDPAGNEGRSAETVNQWSIWVDQNAAVGGDGSEARPFTTISAGVAAVAADGTVWVRPGSYAENLVIGKNLRLLSTGGASVTTITGVESGNELGTVVITNDTTGVTIGGVGQGFHIVGIDGTPQIEKAAVYLQGAHSNTVVTGNVIEANGDAGLTTEYGQAVTGLVVTHNVFSGQTFSGANPGGEGFGDQFGTPNVPRQLVVIGPGASNVRFTNNEVIGTAGGLNDDGAPQGNTLVTIDATTSLIADNTFNGTTTRYGSSLRARSAGTVITGNVFASTGLADSASHLFLQHNALSADLVAANTFDRGVWVADASGGTLGLVLPTSFPSALGAVTVNVLPGTYVLGGHAVLAAPGMTLKGPNAGVAYPNVRGGAATIVGGLVIAAPNVTVSGLDIEGFGPYQGGDSAAIYLAAGVAGAVISNNAVSGTDTPGASRGVVNELGAASSARISGNVFSSLTSGTFVQGTTTYRIEGNLFRNNVAGSAHDAPDSVVRGNTFEGNEEGVGLGAAGIVVEGNVFGAGHDSYVTDYVGEYDLAGVLSANTFPAGAYVGSYIPGWTPTAFGAIVP